MASKSHVTSPSEISHEMSHEVRCHGNVILQVSE